MSGSDERFTPAEVTPEGEGAGGYGAPPQTGAPPLDTGGGYGAAPPTGSGGHVTPAMPGGGSMGQGMDMESRQQFINLQLSSVKEMVAGADPTHVKTIGTNWIDLRKDLVGENWDGGIKKKFDDAVKKVLETWHGKSADAFAKAAQQISQDFAALASHPEKVGTLLEQVSERITEVKGLVEAVQEPSDWDRAMDRGKDFLTSDSAPASVVAGQVFGPAGAIIAPTLVGDGAGRNSSGLDADLANPNITIGEAVNNNFRNLSIDRERQLEAAHHVEQLAAIYRSTKEQIDADPAGPDPVTGGIPNVNGGGGVPNLSPFSPPGGGGPQADMGNMPTPGGGAGYTGQNPGGGINPGDMKSPNIGGANGGADVGTGLDGIGSGAGGLGSGAGGGAGNLGGVSGVGAGGGAGTGSAGGVGAVGGVPGGMAGAGGGARGTGGRMGGMPMGGGAGAGGAGGAKGGASGRGAMARKKGGTVGAAGRAGGIAQGGSGLHRSRGGTQAGAGGARGAGMMGAPGARGAGAGEGRNGGNRPDYLTEEEETWTPSRNVAPRVIE